MSDLHIYSFALETVAMMQPDIRALKRRSSGLGDQIERAAQSIILNLSEGAYSQGRVKKARYFTALGSARETLACLEVGVAFGYLPAVREELKPRMARILGTLTNLAR